MTSASINDPARVVRIDSLTRDYISQKLRVVGRLVTKQPYDYIY